MRLLCIWCLCYPFQFGGHMLIGLNSKVNSLVLSVNDQGYPQINQIISDTNDKSKTDLKFPKHVIGIDTKENIQSGIMYGAIDQVEGMIKRITKEKKSKYKIILTGGFSKLLSPFLSIEHIVDMDLTLKGLYYIYESNN